MKRPWPVSILAIMLGLGALAGVIGFFRSGNGVFPDQRIFLMVVNFIGAAVNGSLAYGLWTLRNWARLTATAITVISAIGLFGAALIPWMVEKKAAPLPLPLMLAIFFGLALQGLIVWYLSMRSTKQLFIGRQREGLDV